MKTNFFIFLLFCLTISCRKEPVNNCACLEAGGQTDKYIFPIVPGMDEWKNLTSHQAMVEVCQVPENDLKAMCTIGLVDTYYDYPILFTVWAFINTEEGIEQVSKEFNAFGELLNRQDCATKLMLRYVPINPAAIDPSWTILDQGRFIEKLRDMEVTLAYEPVCKKLTKQERKELIKIALEKLRLKEENGYGGLSQNSNIYLIANLLEIERYKPFLDFIENRNDLKQYLDGYLNRLQSLNDGNSIKNFAASFLDQK